jgi:hypothetical protein
MATVLIVVDTRWLFFLAREVVVIVVVVVVVLAAVLLSLSLLLLLLLLLLLCCHAIFHSVAIWAQLFLWLPPLAATLGCEPWMKGKYEGNNKGKGKVEDIDGEMVSWLFLGNILHLFLK